jgi:hypothetical protein
MVASEQWTSRLVKESPSCVCSKVTRPFWPRGRMFLRNQLINSLSLWYQNSVIAPLILCVILPASQVQSVLYFYVFWCLLPLFMWQNCVVCPLGCLYSQAFCVCRLALFRHSVFKLFVLLKPHITGYIRKFIAHLSSLTLIITLITRVLVSINKGIHPQRVLSCL